MNENLQAIHPHLMWELGPARRSPGHPAGDYTGKSVGRARPLVREILRVAVPATFRLGVLRIPPARGILRTCSGSLLEGSASLREISARLRLSPSRATSNCVDLQIRGFLPRLDDQQALSIAYVACEALLGEEGA